MKKIKLIILVAALGCFSFVDAQNEGERGIRAGYVGSGLYDNGNQVGDALGGFYGGFYHTNPLKSNLLQWYKGLEYAQNGNSINDDTFRKLHYLSVIQALRVKIGPVFGQVGIAANIKVGEAYEVDGNDIKTDDNKAKAFDFPWHAGLGVNIGPVTVDARYHWGLSDISDSAPFRNQYLQVGAALHF